MATSRRRSRYYASLDLSMPLTATSGAPPPSSRSAAFLTGGDELKILYFLGKVEREATHSGGTIITMNGNHEIMNVDDDFRFVTKATMNFGFGSIGSVLHRHHRDPNVLLSITIPTTNVVEFRRRMRCHAPPKDVVFIFFILFPKSFRNRQIRIKTRRTRLCHVILSTSITKRPNPKDDPIRRPDFKKHAVSTARSFDRYDRYVGATHSKYSLRFSLSDPNRSVLSGP
ncbi:hypothetical protein PIB30_033202 [Stylosanthes scabra]|uniref:Uncharacterized protein n=1 Tax=Stylosanthes scabra TaxID=79078 RepID=A0ABU6SC13_9FABA|nr:hypothetical protein [Stylosanthes scabra]